MSKKFNLALLMRQIIKAMRGFNDFAPAIGEDKKITENQLCERLIALGYSKVPNNSHICDAIRDIRHLYLNKPKFENGVYFWLISGDDEMGLPFEFRATVFDFVAGDKFGRYLAETEDELTKYQNLRYADAANQKKNGNAAGYAANFLALQNRPK